MKNEIQNAAQWIETMIQENPFSDIGITFAVHNGLIVRVTKTISSKEKVEGDKK
ncbi:MAG TPA: hypothetical protein PKI31_12000 [Spirochaetota bacterium]|nr:hypothetical protein [Spirochaetota bacterium]